MRFAFADPPYPGMAHLYKDHPDYAGEVDHKALIARLIAEFPDGWALSTLPRALRAILPLCPADTRVLPWCKPGGTRNTIEWPHTMWEPLLLRGGRKLSSKREGLQPDFHVQGTSATSYLQPIIGAKPDGFCFWLFHCLGALPGDELVDLFPGSGAVGRAWDKYQRQIVLPLGDEREKQTALGIK